MRRVGLRILMVSVGVVLLIVYITHRVGITQILAQLAAAELPDSAPDVQSRSDCKIETIIRKCR